jgi:hypothetical protein
LNYGTVSAVLKEAPHVFGDDRVERLAHRLHQSFPVLASTLRRMPFILVEKASSMGVVSRIRSESSRKFKFSERLE